MIAVIDYGRGNIRSVTKAFEKIGYPVFVTQESKELERAEGLVLPGVGAFSDCMENLKRLNLSESIQEQVNKGKPFLGICLGLQILFSESEEFGEHKGLDLVKGRVVKFSADKKRKIPHMGWNCVQIKKESPLSGGISSGEYFYFVHSYYVLPEDRDLIVLTTEYGNEFVSGIVRDNLWGVQFHPEKSQKAGLRILRNFAESVYR